MVRLAVYGGISTLLSLSVIAAAFRQRSNFYAASIYLSKSSACMMILMNMGFFLTIIFGQLLQAIFFGRLRAVEIEHLYERSWYAVTETCLAMTIFRDEFDTRFVVTFTTLLFLKIFHWLCQDRVEFMEQSPAVPTSFHFRMISLMEILCITDVMFVRHAVNVTMRDGPNMMVMFAFEVGYSILGATIVSTVFKYILNIIDMRREEPWENKSIYVFYLELVTDFFKLITYLIFFTIILTYYGIPLHIIRDVYVTLRSFLQKCGHLVRYRRATRNMNERYPNATDEELENLSDRTCIICREEMIAANIANNDAQGNNGRQNRPGNSGLGDLPKKLPCGHIFHFHCLRSWLERQQSCPTCRRPVLTEQQPTQPPTRPVQRNVQQQPQLQPQPQLPGIPIANPPGFLANPILGFTLFPPPGMQGQWPGPPIPPANINEPNVDQANGLSNQNSTHQNTSQSSQNTTQSNSNQTTNEEEPPTESQPQTTTTQGPSTSTSRAPQSSYQPYIPPAPPGLIPLFPVLPVRNNGSTNPEGNYNAPPQLNQLSEEQIRLLETNTREALTERLRLLQDVQGQVYNIIKSSNNQETDKKGKGKV
ncbi:2603_t:CDS:10 [Diversispora eburnea]|uniref:RING-type E3 ubiquitin transferase n=1 Tax=Diversispora eburnea TaxID=1213867 RepID=A0A9N9F892_9GLOM|nr:2603_t:CDS:10 [Diversispora eburnea]